MKKLNIASFEQFYQENISVLDHSFVGSHPLDTEKFAAWKENFKSTLLTQEATATVLNNEDDLSLYTGILTFIEQFNPIHVSFEAFKERVWNIVDEVFEQKATLLVLLLPEKIEKSGLWVSLIAWERIKEKTRNISPNEMEFIIGVETNLNWLEERVENNPNVHMITMIFDDATYSGTQYAEKTSALQYQRYNAFTSQYGTWTHAVMIPFVSKKARDTIGRTERSGGPKLWFPSRSTIMPEVEDVHETDLTIPRMSVYYPIFDERFDGIFNRGMTYFDHKVADHVSVYAFILKNAPLLSQPFPSNKYEIRIGPSFIKGCGPEQEMFGKDKDKIIDTASNLKPDCFEPPYKRHTWSFQNKKLDLKQTLVQITSKCVMCGKISDKLFREYGMPETLGTNVCSKLCQLKMYHV